MIVADTDVLIDFLSDQDPIAEKVASALQAGSLATTAVTRFELLVGARGLRRERTILELLGSITVLPLDTPAADRAARLHRSLEQQGQAIGMADSLIAGIVLHHAGILLTRNRRHFGRVEGLILADV